MPEPIRITLATLTSVIRRALDDAGVPADIAAIEADVMAEADLFGVPSHGVAMLPRLLAGLGDGRITRAPRLEIRRQQGATSVLDGDNGPGRFVSVRAMRRAVASARVSGIGACLAVRTTHWGRAHAYAWRAAKAGVIGWCTTNAIPTMLSGAPGSARLGNNPMAIGVPRAGSADPVVLDLAMSQVALGQVANRRRGGRPAPTGWGVDGDGQPTNDPAAILSGGSLLPMGGYKGVGLAVMMELLTGALSGGLLGHEIVKADSTGTDPDATKLFVAIDPGAFAGPDVQWRKTEDLIAYLHASGGAESILVPGERGWRAREEHLAHGIPIHPEVVEQLSAGGVRLA